MSKMDNESVNEDNKKSIATLKEQYHGATLVGHIILLACEVTFTKYKLAFAFIVFLFCYFASGLFYPDQYMPEPGSLKLALLPFVFALWPISTIWFYFVAWIFIIIKIVKTVKAIDDLTSKKHIAISFCIIAACYILIIIATENGYYLSV